MEDWKTYRLGDLIQIRYGKDHKALADGPFPAYGSGGLMRSVEKPIYNKQSILIPRKGSLNNIIYVDIPFWTVDTMFWTIIDTSIVLPHYLYYALKDFDFASLNVGSAVPSLTCPVIEAIEVPIPSLQLQRQILNCIEPIDDKIALNNRINHNLEEQAQALYKSWFVDFEPFKGGKFVDSELGLIPEGWRVGKVRDLIDIQSGFAFKSDTFVPSGRYRLITIKAVQDGYLTTYGADYIDNPLPAKMPEYCKLALGDILLSLTGNVGRICIVDDVNLLLNQRVAKLQPINVADRAFVYTLFRNMSFREQVVQLARGTAQLNLSPVETGELSLCIPSRNVLQQFADITMPLFEEILSNSLANKRLELIRDSVLPKFMYAKLTC